MFSAVFLSTVLPSLPVLDEGRVRSHHKTLFLPSNCHNLAVHYACSWLWFFAMVSLIPDGKRHQTYGGKPLFRKVGVSLSERIVIRPEDTSPLGTAAVTIGSAVVGEVVGTSLAFGAVAAMGVFALVIPALFFGGLTYVTVKSISEEMKGNRAK